VSDPIPLRAAVKLGFLPTHAKFVGGLVPDEQGRLSRDPGGELVLVRAAREVIERSRVRPEAIQVPAFPGVDRDDQDEVMERLKELGLEVTMVIMIGGVDPMDPADEDGTIAQMLPTLETATRHGVAHVSSTSVEEWMCAGATRKEGAEFERVVEQLIRLHLRAHREAGLGESSVNSWNIEFLRVGEFATFNDLERLWRVIEPLNRELGEPFFRCLVDPAHAGDSGLPLATCQGQVEEVAEAGGLGVCHASAKTTRGCLSTDDGWNAALLSVAARTGELRELFVEMFHHQDEALAALRELDPGHGVDTCDGRDYTQVVADGLETMARFLNNLVARGVLPARA